MNRKIKKIWRKIAQITTNRKNVAKYNGRTYTKGNHLNNCLCPLYPSDEIVRNYEAACEETDTIDPKLIFVRLENIKGKVICTAVTTLENHRKCCVCRIKRIQK